MARKLPWQANPSSSSQALPPQEKVAPGESSNREEGSLEGESKSTHRLAKSENDRSNITRKKYARSPSTSPPPEPPEIELMHEGLDADDAFIMVEDEFQAVAQSFTAHLHHAEYKRLVNEAKMARRKQLPEIHPRMTRESKIKLQKTALSDKQRAGLKTMTSAPLQEADEDIDQSEAARQEEKVPDPWAGTSLASLMSNESQHKTSLKGLERVSNATRAAQGFRPNSRDGLAEKRDIDETFGSASRKRELGKTVDAIDHDLDFTYKRPKPSLVQPTGHELWSSRREREVVRPAQNQFHSSTLKVPSTVEKPRRSPIDDLDDFDEKVFDRKRYAKPNDEPFSLSPKRYGPSKKEGKKEKRYRLDEVPVFLA